MKDRKPLRSDIAWSTPERVFVRGYDLCADLLGKISLGDMAFLTFTDRLPNERESIVFNALAVTLVEHGTTPSALAARLTYAGAPEAMQAAVAAGIAGLGSTFVGSMENAARLLQESLKNAAQRNIEELAQEIVRRYAKEAKKVPGLGHHFHKPVDPRAIRLFAIAEENGFGGTHIALMQALSRAAEAHMQKPLPVNATGAIAAIASELDIPWSIVRGIGVMARAIGLIGHLREEIARPMARQIKADVEAEVTAPHLEEAKKK